MDSKELRGLYEAYTEVYAPQEEIDEAEKWIQKAIKKPGALHKQLGVPEDEKIPAEKLAAAAKKGGKLGKRARLAQTLGGLNKEEVEIDEAVRGESSERRKDLAAERRAGHRPKSAKEGERYASHKLAQMAYVERQRMGEEVEEVDELYKGKHGQSETEYQDSRSHAGKMISGDSRQSGAAWSHRSFKGVGKPAKPGERQENQGRMDRGTRTDLEYRKANLKKEELDIFDVVLEFLQAEGYAETLEEAEWLMANVIDEEAISIVLGEAQAARENPEGHDREERKKYAPVRGERTPMPPRGDKRREDFEKWYAANVR